MSSSQEGRPPLRAIIGLIIYLLLAPAVLFLAAGTLKWSWSWALAILAWVAAIGGRLVVLRLNPDTLRERGRHAEVEAPAWDRRLGPIVALYGPAAIMLVAGLDHRFGWTTVPSAVQFPAHRAGVPHRRLRDAPASAADDGRAHGRP